MSNVKRARIAGGYVFGALLTCAIAGGLYWQTHSTPTLLEEISSSVPKIRPLFNVRGRGFETARSGRSIPSDNGAAPGQRARDAISATVPVQANGAFGIGIKGAANLVQLHLAGASPAAARLEKGTAAYRDVYADVDVIVTRDPEYVELAYVIRDPSSQPRIELKVRGAAGSELKHEPSSAAVIVARKDGRPSLRIGEPVAYDASGTVRRGTYDIDGDTLRVAMRWEGLTAPVVLDPTISIPYWSLREDDRAPGALSYNATTLSRETQVQMDLGRGKAVLVRPVRTQQLEDHLFAYLGPSSPWAQRGTDFTVRVPGAGGPKAGPLELADWQRSYFIESEIWEWSGFRWSRSAALGAPGLIDPALTYDPKRHRIVAFGGAETRFSCAHASVRGTSSDVFCSLLGPAEFGETQEFDGTEWIRKGVAGAPNPRIRAAMAPFKEGVLLFGGRELILTQGNQQNHYGAPFPDNFARDLLNDTWIYDGQSWEKRPAANPPPPTERGQVVYDERRQRAVLVGGATASQSDVFTIWEFDGKDWIERIASNDETLPRSLRGRRGVTAFWHPVRQSTLLFGGVVERFETCTLTESQLATKLIAATTQPVVRQELAETGCLGGYAHDTWEWDGGSLRQLTQVAFGGFDGDQPVFRQLTGGSWGSPTSPGSTAGTPGATTSTALLPWRYDRTLDHFPLRTTLERAHQKLPPVKVRDPRGDTSSLPVGSATTMVSPLFGARVRPNVAFDPATGFLSVFVQGDGRVFATNGETWSDRTPAASPFATGPNDFFAATWDEVSKQIVLFDPTTAATWTHSESVGWQRVEVASSPPIWSIAPNVRLERDLEPDASGFSFNNANPNVSKFAQAAAAMPLMTYDRARSRVVMLYGNSLWEFDGQVWTRQNGPSSWASCSAARFLAYDGKRQRTVAAGCTVPGQTWEWDGSVWHGPFATPHVGLVERLVNRRGLAPTCHAPLQLAWAHPNALFETTALGGGVGVIEGEGTLRIWNGTEWKPGPQLAEGYQCSFTKRIYDASRTSPAMSFQSGFLREVDHLPMCFFPPVIDDVVTGRIVAFRDGITGMRELRYAEGASAWAETFIGHDYVPPGGSPSDLLTRVHPYPYEISSPEQIYLKTLSAPASRSCDPSWQPFEDRFTKNLLWPFRILRDSADKRIRVLTHRGAIWELGAEQRQGLGEPCDTDLDCGAGSCSAEKVCCDAAACNSACRTCKGSNPGHCELVPAGQPDPIGRCGSGDCARVCSGGTELGDPQVRCNFPNSPRACGVERCENGVAFGRGQCASGQSMCIESNGIACSGGLSCADATTCRTHCAANSDCLDPEYKCSADGSQCEPDPRKQFTCENGVLTRRGQTTGTACLGGLECADEVSCKTGCSSRADCLARTAKCDAQQLSCVPDRVAVLAEQQGITPLEWDPPERRSADEIAEIFRDAGLPEDDAGVFHIPGGAFAGVQVAFDPKLRSPLTGLRACWQRIEACMVLNKKIDECVASTPRCVGTTPWLGDEAGEDCCPEACLEAYFQTKATKGVRNALDALFTPGCYPGTESLGIIGGNP